MYVFYVSRRLWEAHLYVFYVSGRLWEAHLYVFYVSGDSRKLICMYLTSPGGSGDGQFPTIYVTGWVRYRRTSRARGQFPTTYVTGWVR